MPINSTNTKLGSTNKIQANFSKFAPFYEAEASIQKMCAIQLAHHLSERRDALTEGTFLEIGCGTGFVTEEILRNFPERSFCITDLSPTMIQICQEQMQRLYGSSEQISFAIVDAENFIPQEEYAILISGLTFQWFTDLNHTIGKLLQSLKQGGLLLFSFLEAKSFPEWRAIYSKLNLPFSGNPMPCILSLQKAMQTLPITTDIWEETIIIRYPTALQFLKSLKCIGAGTAINQQQLKPHEMRKMLAYWEEQCPDGVQVTYQVAYGALKKW